MKGQKIGFVWCGILRRLEPLCLFVCLALLSQICWGRSQSDNISGRVLSGGRPVKGVSVLAFDLVRGRTVEFAESDSVGQFCFVRLLPKGRGGLRLDFRCLGYKTFRLLLDSVQTFPIEVVLDEEATLLNEVTVKAPRVWGSRDPSTIVWQGWLDMAIAL